MQAWFEDQQNATAAAIDLYKALTSTVYVIWYEAPQEPEFDSRAMFTRLNVGRIPLTDAELVKASLLSHIKRPHETAAQWDGIERDLHSPEVWAFAAAPMLVTRGNHESCPRAGNGWMLLFEIQLKPDSCAPTATGTSAPPNIAPTYSVDFPIAPGRTLR
ncbi:MAG: hypothetical protein EXQ79_04625, partial [Acidimicrobiia bacterium]|nr:hypothetical protein [Acidimicrobiia bacterium]